MKLLPSSIALFLILAFPAHAQWQWLNPLPEGNEFFDATFSTAQTGWVIGGNGTLLQSTDGGMTWSTRENILRTTPFLGLSIAFVDELTGVISMNNGLLLRTSDGGQIWELLPRTGMVIQKVRTAPDGSLWGIGSLGIIARSIDGGLTWTRFNTGITTVVFDIAFPDASSAVAVCGGGKVLRTSDGGQTWDQSTAPLTTDIISVSFSSASSGIAIQQPKYLLRTSDGGQTWSDTSFTVNELLQVRFVDDQHGWLVSNSPGSVFKTEDGGHSWHFVAVEQPRRHGFYGVYPRNRDQVFLLGAGGALFSTDDGGQHWIQRGDAFTRAHLYGVTALSDSSAWVFGERSAFFTNDRGRTWQGSDTIALTGFRSGYALSETRVIATGSQGQVMLSTDAGQTWSTQTLSAAGQIEEVVFVDGQNGWLAGAHGTVARTSDAGVTWIERDPGVTHDFNGISALSADEAWIAGNGGVIFHTSDGGATWTEQTTPIATHLQSIEFLNAKDGWAGGQLHLLRTSDGGVTWNMVTGLAGLDVIYDIQFTDDQHGFFMLSRSVARTSDGGTTFYRTDYTAPGLQDLDALQDGTLWMVGRFGGTQRYTPTAAVVVQPNLLDFGDVAVGKQRELPMTVYNRGEIDLAFNNIATVGAGFLFAQGDLSPLPPGASREISIAFAPQDTGRVFGTATVYSNAALGIPFIDLVGHGVPPGTAAFSHEPDTLDFGTLLLGTFSSRYVRLRNRSSESLLITREVITGGDSTMFQVTTESTFFFASGKEDSVQVTFTPIRPGRFLSSLLVESNDPVEPMYRVPVRGEGVTPVVATGSDILEFGWVLIGDDKTLDLVVKNVGGAPLHISSMLPGGQDAAQFSFTDPGALTIAPGDSVMVPVTFSPTTLGEKLAEVVITSDDLVNPTFAAQLRGNPTTTDVENGVQPQQIRLGQNYPNPVYPAFGAATTYSISVPRETHVTLSLHDALGRSVATFLDTRVDAGEHRIPVNLSMLPSGTYQARLRVISGDHAIIRQVRTIILR
ncbi:MAG: choice-of-anchor D domain-containing protein [Bacteroidetes bacterium]|nr:choice-of-anchor D domain-containing protein [Bacteroidota bacterium]